MEIKYNFVRFYVKSGLKSKIKSLKISRLRACIVKVKWNIKLYNIMNIGVHTL